MRSARGPTLRSSTRGVEQDRTHAGTQHTQDGRLSDTEIGKSGPERFRRKEGDSDYVTQYQDGTGRGTVGGALRPAARERPLWRPSGDEAHMGDSHTPRRGVRRLGESREEQTPRRSCSGVDIKIGVSGRGHCQLQPKRGKFRADDRMVEMIRFRGICATK